MFFLRTISRLLATFSLLLPGFFLAAQCLTYPVPLTDRAQTAERIALGHLVDQESYWNAAHTQIFTLNTIEVTAWLKGNSRSRRVGVLSVGGVVGEWAQISHPSLTVQPWNEYIFFLKGEEREQDHRTMRQQAPDLAQCFPVADAQGALTKQRGQFHDLHGTNPYSEADLLRIIRGWTGQAPVTPEGAAFTARAGDTRPLEAYAGQRAPITSFSPNPTHGGTTAPGDVLTINGSGFGGTPGTIFYSNADDGGATFTASGVASDNLVWSDTQIQNRPPSGAGTGPINVNGAITSATNLTVDYTHIEINSSFAGFPQTTRQNYRHVDKNGSGGYTFSYNTAFAANTAATAAFLRALDTWRCTTQINFILSGSPTPIASVASDGTNVVFFNPALPLGVLGRANSLLQASANGACNQVNTVWWANEIDFEFRSDPPAGCCSWNFGPGASASNEFDFESTALHEMGHGHGLGHIISLGDVMHFGLPNGLDQRSLGASDILGGNDKMAFSFSAPCFNPAGVNGPMTPFPLSPTCTTLPGPWAVLEGERLATGPVELRWELDADLPPGTLALERSSDGQSFGTIESWEVEVDGPRTQGTVDVHAGPGQPWYYRLAYRGQDGGARWSEVLRIAPGPAETGFSVLPTVTQGRIEVRSQLPAAGPCWMRLVDGQGKVVRHWNWEAGAGTTREEFDLDDLPVGWYHYQIGGAGLVQRGKLIRMR